VPFAVSRVTNNSRSLRSPAHQSAPTPKITRFKMTRFYNPVNISPQDLTTLLLGGVNIPI
jgi:hypothetical protein